MGKNKAQVMQWVMYSLGNKFNFDLTKNSEIMDFFVISGDAVSFSLTWVLNKKDKKAKEMLRKKKKRMGGQEKKAQGEFLKKGK